MGLDYAFQIVVPRHEAAGALRDIEALCRPARGRELPNDAAYKADIVLIRLTAAAPLLCARANAAGINDMSIVIVKALGLIGDPIGIRPALRLMREGDGLAPCYALWALRDIGDASTLPAIEPMLASGGSGVREAARQAIAAITARST